MPTVKTLFSGDKEISRENALELAKWKIKAITMGKNDRERLNMINNSFTGISFTLDELL